MVLIIPQNCLTCSFGQRVVKSDLTQSKHPISTAFFCFSFITKLVTTGVESFNTTYGEGHISVRMEFPMSKMNVNINGEGKMEVTKAGNTSLICK